MLFPIWLMLLLDSLGVELPEAKKCDMFIASIGEKADEKTSAEYLKTLFDNDLMTSREYDIARALIGKVDSDEKRADGMRQIILAMMK